MGRPSRHTTGTRAFSDVHSSAGLPVETRTSIFQRVAGDEARASSATVNESGLAGSSSRLGSPLTLVESFGRQKFTPSRDSATHARPLPQHVSLVPLRTPHR